MTGFKRTVLSVALATCGAAAAGDSIAVDENALFADTVSIVPQKGLVDTAHMKDATETKSTNIGGEVIVASIGSANEDFLTHTRLGNTAVTNMLVGSVDLDARLIEGTKVFGNLETDYVPSLDSAQMYSIYLRELFLDFNADRRVYFRIGQQVLQWGTCFFWNPTDLVNVEKKPFIDKIGSQEGTLGGRIHMPFSTTANLYAFVDLHSATRADSIALSVKGEYLIGGTEMALSAWGKRGKPIVLGYSLSTRALGLDITGEAAVSNGNVMPHIAVHDSALGFDTLRNGVEPRVCIGASRSFDFMGFHDALTVEAEGFYNGSGYTRNVFADTTHYPVAGAFSSPSPVPPPRLTQAQFLLASGLYDANYHSPYYAALFIGISRFVLSELTFNVNGIMNISQNCGIVTGSIAYTTLSNLTLGATLIGYLGPTGTEYTYYGQSMALRLTADVRF